MHPGIVSVSTSPGGPLSLTQVSDGKAKGRYGLDSSPTSLFLSRGADVVAAVTIAGYDAPWTRGEFAPGPAYHRYRELFEAEALARRELERARDGGEDTQALELQLAEHQRRLNELELVLSGRVIRDPRLTGEGRIEFLMG